MTEQEIKRQIENQREYFRSGATLSYEARKRALDTLEKAILEFTPEIHAALYMDLGKNENESFMCETGLALSELRYMRKHLSSFMRRKRVKTPPACYVGKSYKKLCPYGTVLVMSPWNYPFCLSIEPLIDALAAGNTVLIKPSAYSPATGLAISKMISQYFDPALVSVILGGREENSALLDGRFDYIFFTGSQAVGREVMKRASNQLTPVTLELGGKSPCIVDATADVNLAARRIVFGKFLNCGQTCVAPDHVYCHISVYEAFKKAVLSEITKQYGCDTLQDPTYGKIINEKHYGRLMKMIEADVAGGEQMKASRLLLGGFGDDEKMQIAPTVLVGVTETDACMQEEIFGPILPILIYEDEYELLYRLQNKPHPLAFYIFSQDREQIRFFTEHLSFGGGCVNDTILHLATSYMPFGGVGESGMGSYHGYEGFRTFSHEKCIYEGSKHIDIPVRYRPYTALGQKLLKWFL